MRANLFDLSWQAKLALTISWELRLAIFLGILHTLILERAQAATLLQEGFEAAGIPAGWSVDAGVWKVGVPFGGAHSGTNSAAVVLSGNYPDLIDSALVSPPFVVPASANNPRLRFWHRFNIDSRDYNAGDYDFGQVLLTLANGSETNISPKYVWSSGWTRASLDLSAYGGQTVQVKFFFHSNAA